MPGVLRGIVPGTEDHDFNDDYRRYYKRAYLVEVKPGEGPVEARACPGLPRMYSLFTGPFAAGVVDPRIAVSRLAPRQWQNHPQLYAVEVTWDSGGKDPDYQADSPLDRPAEVRFRFEDYEEAAEYDHYGTPYLNSAGDRFDPPVMSRKTQIVFEIEKNRPDFDPEEWTAYRDVVNTDPFFGFAAAQLKVVDVVCPGRAYENSVRYFPTKLILAARELTDLTLRAPAGHPWERGKHPWRRYLLDVGFRKWLDPPGVFVNLGDRNNAGGGVPRLLDGNGGELPRGDPPVYLEFREYREDTYVPFTLLFLS